MRIIKTWLEKFKKANTQTNSQVDKKVTKEAWRIINARIKQGTLHKPYIDALEIDKETKKLIKKVEQGKIAPETFRSIMKHRQKTGRTKTTPEAKKARSLLNKVMAG